MKNRNDAILYFIQLLKENKLEYRDGEIWKNWEPRRNWLPFSIRLDKLTTNSYYMLRQCYQNKMYYAMSHRVIYCYFNGMIDDDIEINHIDAIKTNNKIENLEIVTRKGNMEHAKINNLLKPRTGEDHPRCKIKDNDIIVIHNMYSSGNYNQKQISEIFNVRPNQISRILGGKRRNIKNV